MVPSEQPPFMFVGSCLGQFSGPECRGTNLGGSCVISSLLIQLLLIDFVSYSPIV